VRASRSRVPLIVVARLRRRALAVLLVLVFSLVVQAALGGTLLRGPAPLVAVALAACSLGYQVRARASVVGWSIAAAGLTLANQLDTSTGFSALNDLAFFAGLVGAPIVLGHVLGARSAQIRELHERTELLVAEQGIVVAAARAEERSRIAREVHAAIAQRIGEIALQAAGAERIATSDGERALEALAHVESTARASLDEIRQVIGVLREPPVGRHA
jgi:signal transduction histidine kinase